MISSALIHDGVGDSCIGRLLIKARISGKLTAITEAAIVAIHPIIATHIAIGILHVVLPRFSDITTSQG